MVLTHNEVVSLTKQWLSGNEYKKVTLDVPVNPDLSFLDSDGVVYTYEIKSEISGRGGLREGIMQCLESLILGYKSYLVICDEYLPKLNIFLPYLPKFGIIIYSSQNGNQLSLVRDSEIVNNPISTGDFTIITSKVDDKIPKPKIKRKMRVHGYVMNREAKTIRVKGYLRKRPRRR